MNQYSTRMERIDDGFRARIEAASYPSGTPANNAVKYAPAWDPNNFPLAMVYAPESTFADIYDAEEALSRGTLFSDVYFPFECSSCRGNGGMM